jgi:hypothetical protein
MERIQIVRINSPRWHREPARNLSNLPTDSSSGESDKEPSSGGSQELSSRSSGEHGSGSSKMVLQDAPMGDPAILNQQVTASLVVPAPLITRC